MHLQEVLLTKEGFPGARWEGTYSWLSHKLRRTTPSNCWKLLTEEDTLLGRWGWWGVVLSAIHTGADLGTTEPSFRLFSNFPLGSSHLAAARQPTAASPSERTPNWLSAKQPALLIFCPITSQYHGNNSLDGDEIFKNKEWEKKQSLLKGLHHSKLTHSVTPLSFILIDIKLSSEGRMLIKLTFRHQST